MSNPPQPRSGADSVAATRLMLALLDDDHTSADRVLAEVDSVPLLKGLLGWALAFGRHASGGDDGKLRQLLLEQRATSGDGVAP